MENQLENRLNNQAPYMQNYYPNPQTNFNPGMNYMFDNQLTYPYNEPMYSNNIEYGNDFHIDYLTKDEASIKINSKKNMYQDKINDFFSNNIGKSGVFYFQKNQVENFKIIGTIKDIGKDFIVIYDKQTNKTYMLLIENFEYAEFNEKIN